MNQRLNKFIYTHKKLNALFWWVMKRAVFEIKVIEDAQFLSTSIMFNGNIESDFIVKKSRKEYIWQKDKRNVQE